jgi:hypothetical protein
MFDQGWDQLSYDQRGAEIDRLLKLAEKDGWQQPVRLIEAKS